jgi:hypothetical protein
MINAYIVSRAREQIRRPKWLVDETLNNSHKRRTKLPVDYPRWDQRLHIKKTENVYKNILW